MYEIPQMLDGLMIDNEQSKQRQIAANKMDFEKAQNVSQTPRKKKQIRSQMSLPYEYMGKQTNSKISMRSMNIFQSFKQCNSLHPLSLDSQLLYSN